MDFEEVELTEEEQILYFQGLGAIANADDNLDAEELNFFNVQKDELDISERVRKVAKKALVDPPDIADVCEGLRDSEAKFTLYMDAVTMALADGVVDVSEETALDNMAASLGISAEQAGAMHDFVETAQKVDQADGMAREKRKAAIAEAAANLSAVGVPIGAVAISGSVFGVSAAGITSGLAALGLGFGMLSGLGVAVGLGLGTYIGIKKLFG